MRRTMSHASRVREPHEKQRHQIRDREPGQCPHSPAFRCRPERSPSLCRSVLPMASPAAFPPEPPPPPTPSSRLPSPPARRATYPLSHYTMAGPKQPKPAAPAPRLKVVVRRLPADLPEHIFNQSISQWAPREVPEGREKVLTWSSYEKGKVRTR